ncbi:MAG: cytochrome c [Saprospiraceae bacterium]
MKKRKKRDRSYHPRFLISLCLFLMGCNETDFQQGKALYDIHCANCHMDDGTGLRGNIPPLAHADYLIQHTQQLPCIIRYGIQDTITVNGITYNTPMAGIPSLTDIQITNIINYIHHAWGNEMGIVSAPQVRQQLKDCQ